MLRRWDSDTRRLYKYYYYYLAYYYYYYYYSPAGRHGLRAPARAVDQKKGPPSQPPEAPKTYQNQQRLQKRRPKS